MTRIVNVLTIAGVDPSGGAGVLADVKVMSALGVYATAVVTALTAQNTCGVSGIYPVSPDFILQQMDTLFADVRIDAVKIGMLGDRDVICAVRQGLERWHPQHVVLDPVMVAKGGARLLLDEAVSALATELIPLADVLTPNLPEAGVLTGQEIGTLEQMHEAVPVLRRMMKPGAILYLKGGHAQGDMAADIYDDGFDQEVFTAQRIRTKNTHGTGCSLSSAIAALLPQCDTAKEAIRQAKQYVSEAICSADLLEVGKGHGPIHHFVRNWH